MQGSGRLRHTRQLPKLISFRVMSYRYHTLHGYTMNHTCEFIGRTICNILLISIVYYTMEMHTQDRAKYYRIKDRAKSHTMITHNVSTRIVATPPHRDILYDITQKYVPVYIDESQIVLLYELNVTNVIRIFKGVLQY